MIDIEEDIIVQCKKGLKVGRKAVKASKSLIKRHTKRLYRLLEIREDIQSSIDFMVNDAEISRQNIAKYEAEIERYKREIELDRKEIRFCS